MLKSVLLPAAIVAMLSSAAWASCQVIGDSIAKGTSVFFSTCRADAVVGMRSGPIVYKARPGYRFTIISSGSNDFPFRLTPRQVAAQRPVTRANLLAARRRLTGRVVWILPQHPAAAALVREVAARYGDAVVPFAPARDRLHPRSYAELARRVSRAI